MKQLIYLTISVILFNLLLEKKPLPFEDSTDHKEQKVSYYNNYNYCNIVRKKLENLNG